MKKLIGVLNIILGCSVIAMGMWQGLTYGLSADGPVVSGVFGGLFPSLTGIIGTICVLLGWKAIG